MLCDEHCQLLPSTTLVHPQQPKRSPTDRQPGTMAAQPHPVLLTRIMNAPGLLCRPSLTNTTLQPPTAKSPLTPKRSHAHTARNQSICCSMHTAISSCTHHTIHPPMHLHMFTNHEHTYHDLTTSQTASLRQTPVTTSSQLATKSYVTRLASWQQNG